MTSRTLLSVALVVCALEPPVFGVLEPRVSRPADTPRSEDRGLHLSAAQTPAPRPPLDLPMEMRVPIAPTPVAADGAVHLVYELHLTSFSARELTVSRVEVLSDSRVIAQYEGEDLIGRLARPGFPSGAPDRQRLGPGTRAIVYLWLTMASSSTVPATLRHRVTGRLGAPADGKPPAEALTLVGEGAAIGARSGPPLVLAPPLRGGEWVAVNGPSNTSGHRRAIVPVGGAAHIAQRFAIDWVQLRETGQTFTGDRLKNENYRCYGAEALAVSDAVVGAIKDGIPENAPGLNSRAVPITLETIGGNYVILDLGQGRYAFYAHLQPGSLRVKTGDRVTRGQVLGLVGNSGNSTEPHLHFHVGDSNSPLTSEGLPYVLESFEVQGKGLGWKPSGQNAADRRVVEMPTQNAVVRFPSSK